jgi:hypothetical protein
MRFLGFDLPVEWTFERLLHEHHFDLAILFHWFWNGISIPEHYREEIRRISPKAFVAVLTDDQQGVREKQMADLTGQWSDYERSHDFTSREFQVYRRADVVLTISEDDRNAFLRKHPVLLSGGRTFFGMLDDEAADKWRALVNQRKQEIESLTATLTRIDSVDCAPFFTMKKGDGTAADEITRLCQRAVPDIYWYHYFLGLLRTWEAESVHPSTESLRAAILRDEAYI